MNFFEELAEKISFNKIENKKEHFAMLSNRYRNNMGEGKSSLSKTDEAKVYAITRMPATSSAIGSVLKRLSSKNVKSILDIGAGCGAGLVALNNNLKKDVDVTCIENCKPMIEILDETKSILGFTNVNVQEQDMCLYNVKSKYDLVMANYSLNELNKENIENVLKKMYSATSNYILIIEAGTPRGYEIVMKCKEYLINLGMNIVSPCKNTLCPLKNDYCHFSSRLQRPKFDINVKSGTLSYEDEKFSYILLSKESLKDDFDNIIIRHPNYKKGLILLNCCTKNSGVDTIKIAKSQGELYKKARKFDVGDEF